MSRHVPGRPDGPRNPPRIGAFVQKTALARWRRRLAALLVSLAVVSPAMGGEHGEKEAPPVTPIVGPPTPLSAMMLGVQRTQARMARGDKSAYGDQQAQLKAVGAAIAAAGADAFKVKIERDAAIVYLLSGGQPRAVAGLVERGDFPAGERDLLRGAIGYTLGRQSDADALLAFDPKAQSLRLGSQLAYAQSVLLTAKDAKKAVDLLDLARLLGPGGLIEEAALRREILIVGNLRDSDRVTFLARQYVERFGKSIYANNFVQGLTTTSVQFDLCDNLPNLEKFVSLLELVSPEQRRVFLLAIARASVLLGRFDVASEAARRALKPPAAGTSEDARARLFDAISRFPRMSDEEAVAAFATLEREKLVPADRDLLAAASYVRNHIYDLPPLAAYVDTWREASVAAAHSPDLSEASPEAALLTIRRAVAALNTAQALGKETGP